MPMLKTEGTITFDFGMNLWEMHRLVCMSLFQAAWQAMLAGSEERDLCR